MRRADLRFSAVLGFAATLAVVASCLLGPQPEPPGDSDTNPTPTSGTNSSTTGSGGDRSDAASGGAGGSAGSPPIFDASASIDAAPVDGAIRSDAPPAEETPDSAVPSDDGGDGAPLDAPTVNDATDAQGPDAPPSQDGAAE